MAITDYPGWKPNTLFYQGQRFQYVNKLYEVLRPFKSLGVFQETGDITIVSEGGSGGGGGSDGRGIASAVVNEDGDLIITYTDSTTENAGHVRGQDATNTLQSEKLSVTSQNVLSDPSQPIDTDKIVKLIINHLVYTTLDNAAITVTNDSISWNPTIGGMNLDSSDTVIAEYFIQQG